MSSGSLPIPVETILPAAPHAAKPGPTLHELDHGHEGHLKPPRSTLIELTKHCNLNCVHCYIVDNSARHELTTAEVIDILTQLADLGVLTVVLSGGEILLRRDWFELAQAATRLRFSVVLFTNGTLITPAIADQMASLKLQKVEISLHGTTESTVEAVTQVRGAYGRILQGIRLLRARGVHVCLKANLLKANFEEAVDMARQARALGCSLRPINSFIAPRLDDDPDPLQHQTSLEELTAASRQQFRIFSNEALLAPPEHPCGSANQYVCAIGADKWVVSADGYLYPCHGWRVRGFNLRQVRIAEVAGRMEELFPEVAPLTVSDIHQCADGHQTFRYQHCPAMAYRLYGDPRAHIQANCDLVRAQEIAHGEAMAQRGLPTGADHAPHDAPDVQVRAQAAPLRE